MAKSNSISYFQTTSSSVRTPYPSYRPGPGQCGTNKNTGDRGWNCRGGDCCRGFYCQSNGKCKPYGKQGQGQGHGGPHGQGRGGYSKSRGGKSHGGRGHGGKGHGGKGRGGKGRYRAMAQPGAKDGSQDDEEIDVNAIARFYSSESGVDGTVQVDENGNVFIDLDLSNFDAECNELEFGIYNKFDYKDLKSIGVNECKAEIIGGVFNPFGAAESCDEYNGNGDQYFTCSIGDLSGRFGNGIVNENKIIIEGNISENDSDKPGGFCVSRLTPQALYKRSMVFKCANSGDIVFCAPFEIEKSGGDDEIGIKCKELGESCETRDDCCDSECVDLREDGRKECYLE